MAERVSAATKDAQFLNQIINDLKGPSPLARPVELEVRRTVDDTTLEGFITERMLGEAYQAATGKKPQGEAYERLRADVFFSLLCKKLYIAQNDSQLFGSIADTFHLLATGSVPSIEQKSKFFEKALGASISEVDVDTTNQRVYLRTSDSPSGAYMPRDGLAVIYKRDDGWELHLPDGKELSLTEKRERSLMTASEAATRKDMFNAVKELIVGWLELPKSSDPFVRIQTNLPDRSKEEKAFALSLLGDVCKNLGQPIPKVRVQALDFGEVAPSELSEEARNVIAAFRDGTLNFFTGSYADPERYDLRKEQRDKAKANVEQLVGWLDGKKLAHWSLERFNQADSYQQAAVLTGGLGQLHPEAGKFGNLEREKLTRAPDSLVDWLKGQVHAPETLIPFGITGAWHRSYGQKLTSIEQVKIDGQLAGYVVNLKEYSDEGSRGDVRKAAFNASGRFLDWA